MLKSEQQKGSEQVLKFFLASASPRRKDLLKQIGLEFVTLPADIDESSQGFSDAGKYAIEMSRLKALHAVGKLTDYSHESAYVLGADTTVEVDGNILGKPLDHDDAFRMLELIQGKWHNVITGLTLMHAKTQDAITEMECTRVKIRSMTKEMISRYLNTGESLDKAGAYGVQGYGSLIVERIDGCYFNVMGLPIYRLSELLQKVGFEVFTWMK